MRYLLDTNIVSDLVRNPGGGGSCNMSAGSARHMFAPASSLQQNYVMAPRNWGLNVSIGGNDLLIASQAIALGYIIVIDNEREFARIAELPCENWLRA